jgi:hypothetical protein
VWPSLIMILMTVLSGLVWVVTEPLCTMGGTFHAILLPWSSDP